MWRWDQGRLIYFQYDILKRIATVLVKFNGMDISICEEVFRAELMMNTHLPFAPHHYAILRNYKRVFECAFLATVLDNRLFVTDFCIELSKENGKFNTVDDYLLNYISRFRFPFPAFQSYNISEKRCYPFCAIIKYLISLQQRNLQPRISIDDIFRIIIANSCTGYEDIEFYGKLVPKVYTIGDTEKRQIREMVIFISQISILKVYGGYLWLDFTNHTMLDELAQNYLHPIESEPKKNRVEELLNLAKIKEGLVLPIFEFLTINHSDTYFLEGRRIRAEHLKIDRSPLLRKYYRELHPHPICHMCNTNTSEKYPWTEYLLDIHHLLPLSSSITITLTGTSLANIVGLCPNCHRSLHIYYSDWLRNARQDDFTSPSEALSVYNSAKKELNNGYPQ